MSRPGSLLLVASIAAWLTLDAGERAAAHELQPGYLELAQTGPESYEVLWRVPARGERRLAIYPRFPPGTEAAGEPLAFVSGPMYVEKLTIRRPGGLDGEAVRIEGLEKMATDVLVRVERADGGVQTVRLNPVQPEFTVEPPRGWLATAAAYTTLGLQHILLGLDHLLFVLGLLLIVRGRRRLLATITAFTVAHSLTLAAATLGLAKAPVQSLNAAIALSILFLGPEIVRSWRGETSLTLRRPWLVAFLFGLLHGFGFASGLSTIGLPRAEIVQSLLWFNVGVELGQVGFVVLALALARSFRVLELRWPLVVARLPGYAVGTCGAYWTLQRTLPLLLTP
jgi:hydrogenase/urease accessory protein HupE